MSSSTENGTPRLIRVAAADSGAIRSGQQGAPERAVSLARGVTAVAAGVEVLKERLDRLHELNCALQADLARAQQQQATVVSERDRLYEEVAGLEQELATRNDAEGEVARLRRERDALAEKIQELVTSLGASNQRIHQLGELVDRFRLERDGASGEAGTVEAQFGRAVRVIGQLRHELADESARNEEHQDGQRVLQRRLETALAEQDRLRLELAESHRALEEIRDSFLAASQLGTSEEAAVG